MRNLKVRNLQVENIHIIHVFQYYFLLLIVTVLFNRCFNVEILYIGIIHAYK